MLQMLLIIAGCFISGFSGFMAWRCFNTVKVIIFSVIVFPVGMHTAIAYPWPGCLHLGLFMWGYILGIFWKISVMSSKNKNQFSPVIINGGKN